MPGAEAATPTTSVDAVLTAAASTAFAALTLSADQATATPSPTITETVPPPATLTPTLMPTIEPVAGVANNNVTVRAEPRRGADNLGGVFFNQGVQVLARNDSGTWYYILWQDSPSGTAWVTRQAIDLTNFDVGRLPIAMIDASGKISMLAPFVWEITGTPLPIPPVPTGDKIRPATIVQAANVRVCPSTACMALGVLELGQAVNMTGRYGENDWAQIDYPSGPDGKGWVARDSLQPSTEGFGSLPYFNALGTPVTPEPPTATPDPNLPPTATDTPAPTPSGPLAEVLEQTGVFSGPASMFEQLGLLNAREKIVVTGQTLNGFWYQIEYPLGTSGRAYVATKFVRILGDMRFLPYLDNLGTPLPTP